MKITDLSTAYTTWIRVSIDAVGWVLGAAQATFSTTHGIGDSKSRLRFFDVSGCSLQKTYICLTNQSATN